MSPIRFRCLLQIVEKLEEASRARRSPRLTPDTALLAAFALRAWCQHPERDAVALAICGVKGKCAAPCITCVGRANEVQRLYEGRETPFN